MINDGTGSTNPSWGDTITLTITGDDGGYCPRNALAGLTINFTPVPEPGVAALAAVGLLATLRRRRQ